MNPEIQREIAKEARRERVDTLLRSGLRDSPDCMGVHATSVEALEFLVEQGKLSGTSGEIDPRFAKFAQPGDTFFVPIKGRVPDTQLEDPMMPFGDVLKEVGHYASGIAQEHYFHRLLGIDLSNTRLKDLSRNAEFDLMKSADNITPRIAYFAQQAGVSNEKLIELWSLSKKRQGVFVGLSNRLLQRLGEDDSSYLIPGDDITDLRINVPGGITIDDLTGIQARTQEEEKFFTKK